MKIKDEFLHPYCKQCRKERIVQETVVLEGKVIHKKGDFVIDCSGIPKDGYVLFDGKIISEDDLKKVGQFSEDHIDLIKQIGNPAHWAYRNIIRPDKTPWESRVAQKGTACAGLKYQEMMLRCNANRIVCRLGRRSGKTDVLAIKALFYAFTNSPRARRKDKSNEWARGLSEIMVLCPYKTQVDEVFKRIREFIENSSTLMNSIARDVKTPIQEIVFSNGSRIKGFSAGSNSNSGAASSRGQDVHFLIMDEMDYLNQEDVDAINPVLGTVKDGCLLGSSTPSGARGILYNKSNDPTYKEFHFPSHVSDTWTPQLDQEHRVQLTESAYQREILALFGELEAGVFQPKYIESAQAPYNYATCVPNRNLFYFIGGDWNDEKNGSTFTVVEFNPFTASARKVHESIISKKDWNQSAAVNEVIRLNTFWKPEFIYLDEGYGAYQIEILKTVGIAASNNPEQHNLQTARLKDIIKAYNFSSTIDVIDPLTTEKIKKRAKPFLIENIVRFFEQQKCLISDIDTTLIKQMGNYIIKHVSSTGQPIYACRDANIGDHSLDSLALALVGITLENSDLLNIRVTDTMQYMEDHNLYKDREATGQGRPVKDDIYSRQSITNQPKEKRIINHPDDFTKASDEKDEHGNFIQSYIVKKRNQPKTRRTNC